jgi:hypothetical protein
MPRPPHLNTYVFKLSFQNDVYTIKKIKAITIGVAWYEICCYIAKGLPRLLKIEYTKRIL